MDVLNPGVHASACTINNKKTRAPPLPYNPRMYAITIETTFAAAHAIRLPDDSLETLHGHDWRVWVTIQRPQLDAIETVKQSSKSEPSS